VWRIKTPKKSDAGGEGGGETQKTIKFTTKEKREEKTRLTGHAPEETLEVGFD